MFSSSIIYTDSNGTCERHTAGVHMPPLSLSFKQHFINTWGLRTAAGPAVKGVFIGVLHRVGQL